MSDLEMQTKANQKADQIFSKLSENLYYSEIFKKINKNLRPDINIKTDEGIKNLEIKKKKVITAVREALSDEEIKRINEIDDHLNETFEGEQAISESKRA